jgi:Domain of unknown function (DUF4340)
MSNRRLLILSFITLIIIVAAVISSKGRAPQTVIESAELFPGLKDQINSIAGITIESASGTLNLKKQGEDWLIAEAGDYPARFDKVKQTVLTLADMKIQSEKTSNPALFSELGVEDITAEKSTSQLLSLKDGSGNALASVITGDLRTSDIAGDTGVYVRKPGANETWLASGVIQVSSDVIEWIEQNLVNIADDRILDTRIEHPDGSVLAISRAKGQEDFAVTEIPEGKESRSAYFINQTGTILSNLTVENVKAREGFVFPDTATKTTVRTYEGLIASITTANIEGANYIALDFTVDESLMTATATATSDKPEQEAIVIGEPEKKAETAPIDVRKEAAELNSKVTRWVYTIPSSKYALLVKKVTDVTQDKTTAVPEADKKP